MAEAGQAAGCKSGDAEAATHLTARFAIATGLSGRTISGKDCFLRPEAERRNSRVANGSSFVVIFREARPESQPTRVSLAELISIVTPWSDDGEEIARA